MNDAELVEAMKAILQAIESGDKDADPPPAMVRLMEMPDDGGFPLFFGSLAKSLIRHVELNAELLAACKSVVAADERRRTLDAIEAVRACRVVIAKAKSGAA
jgi:hypothetical protein